VRDGVERLHRAGPGQLPEGGQPPRVGPAEHVEGAVGHLDVGALALDRREVTERVGVADLPPAAALAPLPQTVLSRSPGRPRRPCGAAPRAGGTGAAAPAPPGSPRQTFARSALAGARRSCSSTLMSLCLAAALPADRL